MKIDNSKELQNSNLSLHQAFFMACWFNLCNRESLDSDRVSILNPKVGLTELLNLYSFGNSYGADNKRVDVGLELHKVLSENVILDSATYKGLKQKLMEQFAPERNASKADKKNCDINQNRLLVSSLSEELIALIEKHYLTDSFGLLKEKIQLPEPSNWKDQISLFDQIRQLSDNLASAIIANGAGLFELYSFYRNILLLNVDTTTFDERFQLFHSKATQIPQNYHLTFLLRSEGLSNYVAQAGGEIEFGDFKIIYHDPRLCSAITAIKSHASTIAGNIAYDRLGEIIDCLSYTLGKEMIIIQAKYKVERHDIAEMREFTIQKLVPNPNYGFKHEKFTKFVTSMGSPDGPKGYKNSKILSSFRIYRIGAYSENVEARFMTYWTAIESITRDVFNRDFNSDDEKVAAAAVPCIVADYVCKRLTAFLKALHQIGMAQIQWDELTDVTSLTNETFFSLLQKQSFSTALVNQLAPHPYFQYQVSRFATLCQDPLKLKEILIAHENKVTLQIKRIYRARNIITHTGGKVTGLEFLCAHLEHYLKTCLNTLIDYMNDVPTINSPEECFVRYRHWVRSIQSDLAKTKNLSQLSNLIKIHQ